MPVGLHLVEKVESQLLEAGLLPADMAVLHRVIDFAKGDFTLRWSPPNASDTTLQVNLKQQLTGRTVDRPVISWKVEILELEDAGEEGRLLYLNTSSAKTMAAAVADACERVLANRKSEEVVTETAEATTDPAL